MEFGKQLGTVFLRCDWELMYAVVSRLISGRYSVGKGNRVIMSILALNHSTEIWGDDALDFR